MNIHDKKDGDFLDQLSPELRNMEKKLEVLMRVLVDHSRTEWDGMDGERLFMLLKQDKHPKANDDLYTLDEVAEIVNMSVITIRQYVRMGKLQAKKEWRNWMVSSNEIARLMYEKKSGEEVSQNDTMLVIIDALLDDYNSDIAAIHKYKSLKIDDVLDICGTEYNSKKIEQFGQLFERSPIGSVLIEIVSNIPNFFRKTGDLPTGKKSGSNLLDGYLVKQSIVQKTLDESYELLNSETPLDDIKGLFGNVNEIDTLLKIYKTMLGFSLKITNLSAQVEGNIDYIKQLEEKIKSLEEGREK
jgi:hypothetical protein